MTRLEFERRRRGLSQQDLAAALLYDRSIISRLENGQPGSSRVNRRLKHALETYFKIPLAVLLGPIELQEPVEPQPADAA